jgi:hypothetical protein
VSDQASFRLLSKPLIFSHVLTGADEDSVEIDRLEAEIRRLNDDVRDSKYAMMSQEMALKSHEEQLIVQEQALERMQFQNHVRFHEMNESCNARRGLESASESMSYYGPVIILTCHFMPALFRCS